MKTFLLFILVILSISRIIRCQCTIDIKTELNRTATGTVKEPLFLKYTGSEYRLMLPDSTGHLNFRQGENAMVACTSDQKPNTLTFNNKTSSTIFCLSGDSYNINNMRYKVSDFNECKSLITGNTINLNKKCADQGSMITIGFQLTEGRGFITLIEICYNKKRSSSIYAKHIVQGKIIKNKMITNTRPSLFKKTEVPTKVNPQKSFTKSNQLKRFQQIFGDLETAQEFINKTYLARGHLAPDADFIFASWQSSTYYYINTVPQWQSINNGNWKHIESAIRSKANQLKADLEIYTGGFDVLKLKNKKISMENDGLDVPKWSWKIVKLPFENLGIAFLTLNNPFALSSPNALCQDVCNESGWNWKERKSISKGWTICCRVSDLMRVILDVPEEAWSENILRYNN
ncbi:CLUMA_CG002495, isoform A [Clunio marinus]|uniref:CLUMA_CG002495, isoform A n=1 Tax=Clunio marinus TaxID=568069 RepID=A0A1J1HMG0_9DIPT|nr:CLUMA_CG002495, isoform A [Clunio marinus]